MSVLNAYNAVQNIGNSMISNLEKGAINRLNSLGNSTNTNTNTNTNTIESPPEAATSTPNEAATSGGNHRRTRHRKHLSRYSAKKHKKSKRQKKSRRQKKSKSQYKSKK